MNSGARRTIAIYVLSYMRWKSLLTYWMVSMCSTVQSPRAANAFSRACAARTCPAPDDADNRRTRGFAFIRAELRFHANASRGLTAPGGDFFEHSARHVLQLAKTRQIILKFVVQQLRLFRTQLRAQNHVAQSDRMRQKRILFQFFERNARVIVIHKFPREEPSLDRINIKRTIQAIVLADRGSRRVSEITVKDRSETPCETGIAPVDGGKMTKLMQRLPWRA